MKISRLSIAFLSSALLASSLISHFAFADAISTTTKNPNPNLQQYDFYIDLYDINAVVNEEKSLTISETITVNFNRPRHGIIRSIPFKNTLSRQSTTSTTKLETTGYSHIADISCDHPHSVSTNSKNNHLDIKIGNKNKTITGQQTYKINYRSTFFSTHQIDLEEFYFNIIGQEWNVPIKTVNFSITMPKSFDQTSLGFSIGAAGTSGYDPKTFKYTVTDNIIHGQLSAALPPASAITIRAKLPAHYFNDNYHQNTRNIIAIISTIIGFTLIVIVYYTRGRNKTPIIETVEFYPPDQLSCLDIGLISYKSINNKQTISLLVALAEKGFLKIVETKPKTFLKPAQFEFIKLKDYDGTDRYEKTFFKGLFKSAQINKSGQYIVKASSLKNHFYKTTSSICASVNKTSNRNLYFETKTTTRLKVLLYFILIIIAIIPFSAFNLISFQFINSDYLITNILLPAGTIILIGVGIGRAVNLLKSYQTKLGLIVLFIVIHVAYIIPNITNDAFSAIEFHRSASIFAQIILPLTIILLAIIISSINLYTPCGIATIGKVRGFRNFLITAEKSQLEALVEKDPSYFYKILPYTYILGVSKKWIKNFEGITYQPAEWYEGTSSNLNSFTFYNSLNSSLNSINDTINYSPNSGGGGGGGSGSSGGGFSGGGFGGGGGSSW